MELTITKLTMGFFVVEFLKLHICGIVATIMMSS